MFESTVSSSFTSWDQFVQVYQEPIRCAFRSLPFVEPDWVEDLTQSFIVKLIEKDILTHPPAITGRFRDWLFCSIRNHAADSGRKRKRRGQHERTDDFETAPPAAPGDREEAWDADAIYALTLLHLTITKVRRHWEEKGKPEVWTIFDELVLAPLTPGRTPLSRTELLEQFPGRDAQYLDNCATSVKRVFRKVLPAVIAPDLTDRRAPEERFAEWLEILRTSRAGQCHRLHLAFRATPLPSVDGPIEQSLNLVPRDQPAPDGGDLPAELQIDELRVLQGFWLAMPFEDYLAGPKPGAARTAAGRTASEPANILALIDSYEVEAPGLLPLLDRLKAFAKRTFGMVKPNPARDDAQARQRREHSMPAELAQVLYNLATALALLRCRTRIASLDDSQLQRNLVWLLNQSWLDKRLRPVFQTALKRLDAAKAGNPKR